MLRTTSSRNPPRPNRYFETLLPTKELKEAYKVAITIHEEAARIHQTAHKQSIAVVREQNRNTLEDTRRQFVATEKALENRLKGRAQDLRELRQLQMQNTTYLRNLENSHQRILNESIRSYEAQQREFQEGVERYNRNMLHITLSNFGDSRHNHLLLQDPLDISRLEMIMDGAGRKRNLRVTFDGIVTFRLENSRRGYWVDEYGQTRVTITGNGIKRQASNFHFTNVGYELREQLQFRIRAQNEFLEHQNNPVQQVAIQARRELHQLAMSSIPITSDIIASIERIENLLRTMNPSENQETDQEANLGASSTNQATVFSYQGSHSDQDPTTSNANPNRRSDRIQTSKKPWNHSKKLMKQPRKNRRN